VQPAQIGEALNERLGRLHEVASRLYDRWVDGLSRES
jgi:hypothetical protein